MLKKFLRKLVLKEKASSESYIEFLRNKGVEIGENVRFYSPNTSMVDASCPWLVSIGNNVIIAHGVIIICHDFSYVIPSRCDVKKGRLVGGQAPVKIGSNVFLGINVLITKGVTIGDNVIIGAGSVVTKDCEPNSVYAGSPAKRIMSLDDYYKKREEQCFEEAKALAIYYKEKFGKTPPVETFYEYFQLFYTAEQAAAVPKMRYQMVVGNHYDDVVSYMNSNPPRFNGYEEFLRECYK